jgi:hypothetical protein
MVNSAFVAPSQLNSGPDGNIEHLWDQLIDIAVVPDLGKFLISQNPKNLGKWDNSWEIWRFLRFYLKLISLLHFFGMTFCPDLFFSLFPFF